ncbi:hypothetical protein M413DRAFT_28135 [Hebeloma cylindrosporum]|uniref:Uncharacterized protein n=1 Tax=Hebeloma cylindrosporum TaxID=76867 RepID=A0A0C3C9Y7_HEBCY|nr:hypothetical protein M413DRAFT_28135 [Hebeloma cylindrosporum h7]
MTKDTSLIDAFPFSSYLNSNYIPLDEEVVQIKAYLTHSRKRLEEMRAEMDGPHGQVELSVKLEYDILYDHIESCASLITLPRRVPDDVLQEIFYQTLPTDRNALLDNNAAPLILTRISRQWRQVAFATPRLWSTIHVYVVPRSLTPNDPSNDTLPGKPPPQKQDELRATAAFEWLNRSGDFPLHISLVANSDESSYPPAVEPYLSALIPFSSRWKNLVVEGHSKTFSRIFTLGSADLRSLESLILDFDPWAYDNHGRELTSSLSNCGLLTSPSLRKLSIRMVIMLHPTNLNLDWSQFTHLELGASSGSRIKGMLMPMCTASEILHVCTGLVSCRIKTAGWAHYGSIHPMQLPFLRHLSLDAGDYFFPFTDKLEVPGLQEFDLRVDNGASQRHNIDYKRCLAPLFRPEQGSIQKLNLFANLLSLPPTGMIEFIKRKQEGNIPKLAKLKKVALQSDIERHEETDGLLPKLQPYISQGLIFYIYELDAPEVDDRVEYGNSAGRYCWES